MMPAPETGAPDAHDAHREWLHGILDRRARRFRARADTSPPIRRAHLLHTADQLGRIAHLLTQGAEDATHAEAWIEATEHI